MIYTHYKTISRLIFHFNAMQAVFFTNIESKGIMLAYCVVVYTILRGNECLLVDKWTK